MWRKRPFGLQKLICVPVQGETMHCREWMFTVSMLVFFIVTSGIRPSAVNQVCGRNGRVSNPAVHSGSRSVPEFTHTPWLQGGKISITVL